jgi:hypothetical protein
MLPNAFIGKLEKPTDADLTAALGPAKALWNELLAALANEYKINIQEWNSYSRKAGWSLRLIREKRAILYLSPCRGCFFVSFALGDRAVEAARQSGLPRHVIKIINEAKRYAEGTAVRIEMKKPKDIDIVKRLAAIKMDH